MKRTTMIITIAMILAIAWPVYAEDLPTHESTAINQTTLIIEAPEDIQQIQINSHLQPMNTPLTIAPEYSGPVFKDHKFQKEILNFMLRNEGLRPFTIETPRWFVKKSSKSSSSLTIKEDKEKYPEQTRIYVFRDEEELKNLKEFKVLGYTDTYSKGKATLMDCFDQAVIDTGEKGGNALVILKVDFMAGMKSTTVGLGTSGAAGFLYGGNEASVYGGAIGYASSKATPQTNPYIHGIILYSEELVRAQ